MSDHNLVRRIYTFGHGQPNFPGYVVVWGIDGDQCRERMNFAFGGVWSMEYRNEEEAGVEEWHLPRIAVIGEVAE